LQGTQLEEMRIVVDHSCGIGKTAQRRCFASSLFERSLTFLGLNPHGPTPIRPRAGST